MRGRRSRSISGDFVALMGPSGSGKTTFLGVLAGLDEPDEGEVRWKGQPMQDLSIDERRTLRQTGIGVVFQSFGLLPALTALENVELPLRVNGADLGEAHDRAEDWLRRLGWRPGCTTARTSCRRDSSARRSRERRSRNRRS